MDALTQQVIPCALSFTDGQGRPATVEGVPAWASSDDTILAVTPAADGLSASIATVGRGTARISVQADADLGAGVLTITGTSEDVLVSVNPNSQAQNVRLSLGTPVDAP